MTPGSYLIMSGALIMATVSVYDLCESAILGGLQRRARHKAQAEAAPNQAFAARLERYGRRGDAPPDESPPDESPPAAAPLSGVPQEVVREQTTDPLDDLVAFHAWLVAGRARAAAPPPLR